MTADVCLVLEGTYPFVMGGVSTWVHNLITGLPDVSFRILHVSPNPNTYPDGALYELPDNVIGVDEIYLNPHEDELGLTAKPGRANLDLIESFRTFMGSVRKDQAGAFETFFRALNDAGAADTMREMLLQSPEAWEILLEAYRSEADAESFIRFVWNWRFALAPLITLLSAPIPEARCYHTICTGYAGLIAAGAKARTGRPMILTEHGIYTKERRIDIQTSDWIPDREHTTSVLERSPAYFKHFWMRQFEVMSRVCYEAADEIFTLYEGNRRLQVQGGADRWRVRIVPNGIDIDRFGTQAPDAESRDPELFTIGFIGRVCAIKDVRTLLQSLRLVVDEIPLVRLRIFGPVDDEAYAEECRRLARVLRLQDHLLLEGRVDVRKVLPTLDVVVLSSISEAQPLTLLEVGAMGIPSVATDVGSCRELLYGRTPEDKALGEGGIVVPMASPGALAQALVRLAREPNLRREMGEAMRRRVRRFYDERDMVKAYEAIYERHICTTGAA